MDQARHKQSTLKALILLGALASPTPATATPPDHSQKRQQIAQSHVQIIQPGVKQPFKATINPSFLKLKNALPNLNLKRIKVFSNLQNFKVEAGRTPMTIGKSKINLAPFINNPNSLTSLSSSLNRIAVPGTISSKAEILRSPNNGGIAIVEEISFQPKPSACKSTQTKAARDFCFTKKSKRKKGGTNSSTSSLTLSRLSKNLKINLNKKANGSNANLPSWAKNASPQAIASLSQASESELTKLMLDNAQIRISNTLYLFPSKSATQTLKKLELIQKDRNNSTQRTTNNGNTSTQTRSGTYQIGPNIFLTGFTYADSFFWSKTFEYNLDYGAGSTLMRITPYTEFSYGLGLRFPVQIEGQYTYNTSNKRQANIQISANPINGSYQQYQSTGLSGDLLFGGREIVAEIAADAGIEYQLPAGNGRIRPPGMPFRLDFTEHLPSAFKTNRIAGDFAPPNLQRPLSGIAEAPIDLLAGKGDYTAGDYGFDFEVKPALKINLNNSELGFTLQDLKNNSSQQVRLRNNNQSTKSIRVDSRGRSKFKIKDPYYELTLNLTPGIRLKGSVDVGAWEKRMNEFIPFPALAIKIPSDGLQFDCHKGTICGRTYTVNNRTGGTGSTADQAEKIIRQNLTLTKTYRIKDDEVGRDEFYNKTRILKLDNVARGREGKPNTRQFKKFIDRGKPRHCAGGEVRLDDWDVVKISKTGAARLWVSLEVFEGISCSTNEREGRYRGAKKNGTDTRGNRLLLARPGECKQASKRVNTNDGGYGKITYKLCNRNAN